jgi:8-oxo-dGTP diphosphatase
MTCICLANAFLGVAAEAGSIWPLALASLLVNIPLSMKKHHEVVAAIITRGEQILCLQRGGSKYDYISHKWEFPGGKVEEGETQEGAIIREIKEELGLGISVDGLLLTLTHEYPDFIITMHGLRCQVVEGELVLHEHVDFRWLTKDQLPSLDWAAADVPLVEQLLQGNE